MNLSDYAPELDDLADLAGDFQPLRYEQTQNWIRRQWSRVADDLGFREQLERHLHNTPKRRLLISADSLRVFSRWFETRVQPQRDPEQARVRHQCLSALRRSYTTNLWLPELDSQRLPESACFTPEGMTGSSPIPRNPFEERILRSMAPTVQPRRRAFRSDVTASFFHDRDSRRPEGCNYRVKLALGTFPYVYGRNLGAEPPGLFWASVHSPGNGGRPAVEAMRIAASMWTQQGNLAQDALRGKPFGRRGLRPHINGNTTIRQGRVGSHQIGQGNSDTAQRHCQPRLPAWHNRCRTCTP